VFCPFCGASAPDDSKFCVSCGKSLAPPQEVPAPPPPAPAYQAPPPPQPAYQPPPPVEPAYQAPPPPPPVYQTPPQPPAGPPPQPAYQPAAGPLQYTIFGENLPAVSIRLNPGESIFTQSGGMTWMDAGITMATNMQGGFMKGLGRMVSGESLFMATYTSTAPNQEIVIASSFAGNIVPIDVTARPVIAQRTAFLCAQPTVTLSAYVTRSIKAGLFGGEGFVLQKLAGAGIVFIEIDGSLKERTLAPGETIKVDTGNVAAFEETVTYQAEMVKGFKNILFGGEGLFLTTLTGPGKVWLQTMSIASFAKQIIPFLPKPSS